MKIFIYYSFFNVFLTNEESSDSETKNPYPNSLMFMYTSLGPAPNLGKFCVFYDHPRRMNLKNHSREGAGMRIIVTAAVKCKFTPSHVCCK